MRDIAPVGEGAFSDAALLERLAEGDVLALRELYDRHSPWLSIRLGHRCNDAEVVADVLQDTFVTVWQRHESFRGEGAVGAWLWGIAVRKLLQRVRGRKFRVVFLADEVQEGHRADRRALVEEQVLLDVDAGDLGAALRGLSPEMRAVVQATILDGLTTKEASRMLRIPENTVKTRLHRAKGHMRDALAEAGCG